MFDLFKYSISQRAHDLTMKYMQNNVAPDLGRSIDKYLEVYNFILAKLEIDAIRNADEDQFNS